jgi:hypothetical protein
LKTLRNILLTVLIIVVSLFLFNYILWFFQPKNKLGIYILDKTVKDFKYEHHKSLFEVINKCRLTKNDGSFYDYKKDYFGFFPRKPISKRQYQIKKILIEHMDSISEEYDALYYADTYGVYYNEWFPGFREGTVNSVIEGGLNHNDFIFLKKMMDKRKLVILEYNTLGNPTSELIRYKTENLLGVHTTGWTGKYFSNLDTTSNKELPDNLINRYFTKNNRNWPYKGQGIILTNNTDVLVLQKGIHIKSDKPYISSCTSISNEYQLSENLVFLNRFEIVSASDTNEILANFNLNLTPKGDSLLHSYGLSSAFPAVISCHRQGKNMYYFAGDFANNPVTMLNSKFEIVQKSLDLLNFNEHKMFFHGFYLPLMEGILTEYLKPEKK